VTASPLGCAAHPRLRPLIDADRIAQIDRAFLLVG
jgi:hypothetical protein